MHKPNWYKDGEILIINSETCGINKDGNEQYLVDPSTGVRSNDTINDKLGEACEQIKENILTGNPDIFFLRESNLTDKDIYIPKYHSTAKNKEINDLVENNANLSAISLGELVEQGLIEITNGHGSPSSDQRLGEIPYIKVSDLRAGSVNINPTNRVPLSLAQRFWRGAESALKPYDLISPERASKNIGEFCVLMPGQQNVVLTKEVIVIRVTDRAPFTQFYLMWALSLAAVRKQWERIVFMQTNREDVGNRLHEIIIPFPQSPEYANELSTYFKTYYESIELARKQYIEALNRSSFEHHIHLGDSE